eukprot:18930-Heterococcus_DN1.PRE.1
MQACNNVIQSTEADQCFRHFPSLCAPAAGTAYSELTAGRGTIAINCSATIAANNALPSPPAAAATTTAAANYNSHSKYNSSSWKAAALTAAAAAAAMIALVITAKAAVTTEQGSRK